MRREINNICYLCGGQQPDSKDHIPPKWLFYQNQPLPSNLFTIPAHQKCQEAYSKDEEYFITTICTASWGNNAAWGKYWNEISPKLKIPVKGGLLKSLLDAMISVPIKTASGIYLGNAPGISVGLKRINRVIIKIVRALYYKHFARCLTEKDRIEISLYGDCCKTIIPRHCEARSAEAISYLSISWILLRFARNDHHRLLQQSHMNGMPIQKMQ